jgi:hypothetical protein
MRLTASQPASELAAALGLPLKPLPPPVDESVPPNPRRRREVTFLLPTGVDPAPQPIFKGKGEGLRLAPLQMIGKADSGDLEAFSKLVQFSPAYLASIMANCPPEEEEEETREETADEEAAEEEVFE